MAGTITFSGLSSGLDTSSWVDALVSAKTSTITTLKDNLSVQQNIQNVVSSIKSYFTSFQSCLQKITDAHFGIANLDVFAQNIVKSSNTNIVTATASTEAARQSYDVLVEKLATSTKAQSGRKETATVKADLNTKLGDLGVETGAITVGTIAFSITENDTIKDLIKKFSNIGISANFDEKKAQLTVNTNVNNINDGTTKLKTVFGLYNKNVQGYESGSIVNANRNSTLEILGVTAGKVKLKNELYTISKSGSNYTIKKDGTSTSSSINNLGQFLDYLKNNVGATTAEVNDGHITIRGAVIETVSGGSNIKEALKLVDSNIRTDMKSDNLSFRKTNIADLSTKLSDLGITSNKTLSVDGGTAQTFTTNSTLQNVKDFLNGKGVDFSIDDKGVIDIDTNGKTISGTLIDALGLIADKSGTTLSGATHTVTYYADENTLLSELGITNSMKYNAYTKDGTAVATNVSNLAGLKVSEFVAQLNSYGLNASFDSTNHKIVIENGYISGDVADKLGMVNSSTTTDTLADKNTSLEKLGATGDLKLSINGGAEKTYAKTTTLETILNDITTAGGTTTIKNGVITVNNATLSGTLVDFLGLTGTAAGSEIKGGPVTVGGVDEYATGTTALKDLGASGNTKLSINGGTEKTYANTTQIQTILDDIISAGGTASINNGVVTVSGVTLSGEVVNLLNLKGTTTSTGIESDTLNYISQTSTTSTSALTPISNPTPITGDTKLSELGITTNQTLSDGSHSWTFTSDMSFNQINQAIKASNPNITLSVDSQGAININNSAASPTALSGSFLTTLGIEPLNTTTTITSSGVVTVGGSTGPEPPTLSSSVTTPPSGLTNLSAVGVDPLQSEYYISSSADLVKLSELVNSGITFDRITLYLTQDIDMSGVSNFTPIGYNYDNTFKGTFDGCGHVIKNLSINSSKTYVGLFGKTGESTTIENLGLEDVDIRGTGFLSRVGGLVGEIDSYCTITNCYVTGNVTATGSSSDAGGLVGVNDNYCTITNCYSAANVTTTDSSSYAGGLVGRTWSRITNCFATGIVTATDSSSYAGGLVGRNYHGNTTECYSNSANALTVGEGDSTGVTAATPTEIKAQAASNGWSFNGDKPVLSVVSAPSGLMSISSDDFSLPATSYYISSIADLNKLADLVNGDISTKNMTFYLTQDIDMSSVSNFTPIGTKVNPFQGTFDGCGHVIKNLTINSSEKYVGLFGYTNNVTIKDLGLEDVDITETVDSDHYAGGLVGYTAAGGDTITNCYVTGNVTLTLSGTGTGFLSQVGGLVGLNCGTITNCYSTANVTLSGTGSSFYENAGGLVGYNKSTITNCFATGDVTTTVSSSCAGGLVGYYYSGTITNCFATGNVARTDVDSYAGGLVGDNDSSTITNCYSNSENALTVGNGDSTGVTAKTVAEILDQSLLESIGFTSANGWVFSGSSTSSNPLALTNTVGELMGGSTGSITIKNGGSTVFNKTYASTVTIQDVINEINSATGGTLTLNSDGSLSFTGNGDISFEGDLANALNIGASASKTVNVSGYKSDPKNVGGGALALSGDTTLDTLGITSGKVNIFDSKGNKLGEITIDNTKTLNDLKSQLSSNGFTLTVDSTNKKVTIVGDGDKHLVDDSSNLVAGLKLATPTETTSLVTGSTKMSQLGFYSGTSMNVVIDGEAKPTLNFGANSDINSVISALQALGINAEIVNGKFSASSDTHQFRLSGELADFLTSGASGGSGGGSGTGYIDSTVGYESNPALKVTSAETLLSEETTLKDLLKHSNGGILRVTIDGSPTELNYTDPNTKVKDIINDLASMGITASVTAAGEFIATCENKTIRLSGEIGNALLGSSPTITDKTTGYVSDTLKYGANSTAANSDALKYSHLLTATDTLESMGFSSADNLRVTLDGSTMHTFSFSPSDTMQDIIDTLATLGITTTITDGKVDFQSTDHSFSLGGAIGNYFNQGATTTGKTTGYTSPPLTYETTENIDLNTKLTDLGVRKGYLNIIKDGTVLPNNIIIDDDTTIEQLFNALKVYNIEGSIITDASGKTHLEFTSDDDVLLVDGTTNLIAKTNLAKINTGDYDSDLKYWDNNATSGLLTKNTLLADLNVTEGSFIFNTGSGTDAVQHIIDIEEGDTIADLLNKLNDEGVNAYLDNGVIKFENGFDGITTVGGSSNLATAIGLKNNNRIDQFAIGKENVSYETLVTKSVANFADGNTALSTVNITNGSVSIYVDGVKATVNIGDSITNFKQLFDAITTEVAGKTGVTVKAGFVTTDGTIKKEPTSAENTGIIAIEAVGDHKISIGASNDTSNFATIANLQSSTEETNRIEGSRALYKVNINSKITEAGLFKTGNVTAGSFKIGDEVFTIDSNTTLNDLIYQINYSEKSYANAYWDTLSGTLVLEADKDKTGASLMNIESGTSNFTHIMGFTQVDAAGVESLVVDSQKLGDNAQVRINGTLVTSTSNTITSDVSKIQGLTLNLKSANPGEHVTVTVEQDKDGICDAVSDVIDAYNALMENFEKEVDQDGKLSQYLNLKVLKNNIKRTMTQTFSTSSVFRNLMAIGISTGKAQDSVDTNVTALVIDKDKFMENLELNPDEIKNLLVGTKINPGVFLSIGDIVDTSLSQAGILTITENRLNNVIENYNKKITKQTDNIDKYRARLEAKFKSMESVIAGFQNTYKNFLNS